MGGGASKPARYAPSTTHQAATGISRPLPTRTEVSSGQAVTETAISEQPGVGAFNSSREKSAACGNCGATNILDGQFFSCRRCGALMRVPFPVAVEQAQEKAEAHAAAAALHVSAILAEQASLCRRLLESVQDELQLEEVLWTSQGNLQPSQAQAVREAIMSLSGDPAGLADALESAQVQGLSLSSSSFLESLAKLRREEDLEVLWRCLSEALQERDRPDLEFWASEAGAQNLDVGEDVECVVHWLREEELARLALLEYETSLQQKCTAALRKNQKGVLQQLAREARELGADPSPAEAALESLRIASRPVPTEEAEPRMPGTEYPLDLAELRRRTIQSLVAELKELGIPLEDAVEKEELVQLLIVARQRPPESNEREPDSSGRSARPNEDGLEFHRGDHVEYYSKNNNVWIPAVISTVYSDGTFGLLGKDGTLVRDRADKSRMRLVRKNGAGSSTPGSAEPPPQAAPKAAPRVRVRVKGKKTTQPKPEPEGAKPEADGKRDESHAHEEDHAPPAQVHYSLTRATALARLGLHEGASSDDIRRAYKQAALRWHPDRKQNHGREGEARVRFQEAKEAFDYLCGDLQ